MGLKMMWWTKGLYKPNWERTPLGSVRYCQPWAINQVGTRSSPHISPGHMRRPPMVVRIDSQATPPPMTRSITHTTVLTQSELNRPRNVWPWNDWVRLERVNQDVPW